MARKDITTKVLAVTGTLLVWFPILATVILSVIGSIADRVLRFDYLMPAELFLFALVGGLLLTWAAIRARARRGMVVWGLIVAAATLAGGQTIAVVTGLASGARGPTGWPWVLTLGSLVAYTAAIVVVGAGGVLLLRDLFMPQLTSTE